MRVAVLGVGAIGGLVLGYLKEKGIDVCGVVRPYQVEPLVNNGLIIEGVREKRVIKELDIQTRLRQEVDLAIFSVKTQDLEEVIDDNKDYLRNSYVVSMQNGIAADYILGKHFDKERVISGIVMFGATFFPPNRVLHHFEGSLILGSVFGKTSGKSEAIKQILSPAFSVEAVVDILGRKYLKLFINLSNGIPACLGKSMQESFSDLAVCRQAIRLIKETHNVINNAGIILDDLPGYPAERVYGLVNMDEENAAGIFSQVMTGLSKEPLYGSILQSIRRGKKSEIDYINGEVVRLAKERSLPAPLNEAIVKMVHEVERSGRFFSKKDFLTQYAKS